MVTVNRNIGPNNEIEAKLETGSQNPSLVLTFPASSNQSRCGLIEFLSQFSNLFSFTAKYFIGNRQEIADDPSSDEYSLTSAEIELHLTPAGQGLLNCSESLFATIDAGFVPMIV